MYLNFLRLIKFRNHSKREFQFHPKLNLIFGNNGVGKTNVLEAISYLSLTKSSLIPRDVNNVMEGQDFFRLEGVIVKKKQQRVVCTYEVGKKKQIIVNDNPIGKATDYIGTFPLLMIHPYDLDLIREGSGLRRKIMDTFLCQMNNKYLLALIENKKALKHRNSLLKKFNINKHCNWDESEPFEYSLIKTSKIIYKIRKEWCTEIIQFFDEVCHVMSPQDEKISLQYYCQLEGDNLEDLFLKNRDADVYNQRTSNGIHKDDLKFKIRGVPINKFGSLGQQKTFLLALKVAMIKLSRTKYDKCPMFLLDDLFGQLDESRISNLLDYIINMDNTQIFIADAIKQRTMPLIKNITSDFSSFDI